MSCRASTPASLTAFIAAATGLALVMIGAVR